MERKEQLQQMVEAYRELRVPKQERTILYEVIQKAKKDAARRRRRRRICYLSGGFAAAAVMLVILPKVSFTNKSTGMDVTETAEEEICAAASLEESFYVDTDVAQGCEVAENEAARLSADERYDAGVTAAAKESTYVQGDSGETAEDMEGASADQENASVDEEASAANLKEMFQEYNRRRPRMFVQGTDKSR